MLLVSAWNVVLKCLALCLITTIAARFLHLYACLTCSSVHADASSLHPLLGHHHQCCVDVFFSLYFFLFLWYVTFLCDSYVLYLFFFCWAYVKPHFRLVFQIYLLVFLWWLPLNCTNLVTLLFRVIVLVVYTGFICGKKITLSSVVVYILENFLLIWGLVLPFKFGFTIISQAFFSECWLVGLLERPVGLFTQRFTTSSNL